MNVSDYWPMAREYSVWNATVATLQFGTADFKAHVLSSAIQQVYNTFFYTTSAHLLHQQLEEILFGCFVIKLNAAFERNLHSKTKDMRVAVKILTFPLLSDEPPESTISPVMTTSPLTLPPHTAWDQPVMPQTCMTLVILE